MEDEKSIAPYIRIGLRYIAGYLVFKSVLPPEIGNMLASDPALVAMIGGVIAVAVEWAYALARKWGWAK
jgi:hypothetical protein